MEAMENYQIKFIDFLDSTGKLVEIQEKFINKNPGNAKDRYAILKAFTGDLLNIHTRKYKQEEVIVKSFDPKEGFKTVDVKGYVLKAKNIRTKIPNSKESFEKLKESSKTSLLFIRRQMYILTRKEKYKSAYEESNSKIHTTLKDEIKTNNSNATKEDNKITFDKEGPETQAYLKNIKKNFKRLVQQRSKDYLASFNEANKKRFIYPQYAFEHAMKLVTDIDAHKSQLQLIKYDLPKLLKPDQNHPFGFQPGLLNFKNIKTNANIAAIKQYCPNLLRSYLNIADNFKSQSELLASEIILEDKKIHSYQKDFIKFTDWAAKGPLKTYNNIVSDIKEKDIEPTEAYMVSVKNNLQEFMKNSVYLQMQGRGSNMQRYFQRYKNAIPEGDEGPVAKLVNKLEKSINESSKSIKEIFDSCKALNEMEGEATPWEKLTIFAAAVAGAVAATFLMPATGGASMAAFIAVSAGISAGATLGGAYASHLWGNENAFNPKQLLISWSIGTAFCLGAQLLAPTVGGAVGGLAKNTNKLMTQSRFTWIRKFGERGLNRQSSKLLSASSESAKKGFGKAYGKELIQESFEDGLEGVGRAAVATDPDSITGQAAGFLFSLLGSSYGKMKNVESSGNFSATPDITGHINNSGIVLNYGNRTKAREYLVARNASPEILTEFNLTGQINTTIKSEGIEVTIQINPTTVPASIRQIMINAKGSVIKDANLQVTLENNYIYSGNSAKLIKYLESHCLVNQLDTGDIVITDSTGTTVKIQKVDIDILVRSEFEKGLLNTVKQGGSYGNVQFNSDLGIAAENSGFRLETFTYTNPESQTQLVNALKSVKSVKAINIASNGDIIISTKSGKTTIKLAQEKVKSDTETLAKKDSKEDMILDSDFLSKLNPDFLSKTVENGKTNFDPNKTILPTKAKKNEIPKSAPKVTASMLPAAYKLVVSHLNSRYIEEFNDGILYLKKGIVPLDQSIIDLLLNTQDGVAALTKLLETKSAIKLNTKLTRQNILDKIKDIDEFSKIRKTLSPLNFGEALKVVKSGASIQETNQLANILKRLSERDPEGFRMLSSIDNHELLVSSGCLESVISGRRKINLKSNNGDFTAYIGKEAGSGGVGKAEYIIYQEKGTKPRIACLKRKHSHISADLFAEEIAGAQKVSKWGHPNIIKPLAVGSDFIIYETGAKAFDLFRGLDKLPADKWLNLYKQQLATVKTYWDNGVFHGDLKSLNVLTFIDESGKRVVKIIDNAPIKFEKSTQLVKTHFSDILVLGEYRVPWPQTVDYSFLGDEITLALNKLMYGKNLSIKEVNKWMGRAQDVKAQSRMLHQAVLTYFDKKTLPKLSSKQKKLHSDIMNLIGDSSDIMKAGKPGFIDDLARTADDLFRELPNLKKKGYVKKQNAAVAKKTAKRPPS